MENAMNVISQAFDIRNKAAKQYNQSALFGQLAAGCDFKFEGRVWTRNDKEGAYRFNGAGETVGITHIPGSQEVMIRTD